MSKRNSGPANSARIWPKKVKIGCMHVCEWVCPCLCVCVRVDRAKEHGPPKASSQHQKSSRRKWPPFWRKRNRFLFSSSKTGLWLGLWALLYVRIVAAKTSCFKSLRSRSKPCFTRCSISRACFGSSRNWKREPLLSTTWLNLIVSEASLCRLNYVQMRDLAKDEWIFPRRWNDSFPFCSSSSSASDKSDGIVIRAIRLSSHRCN